MDSNYEGGNDFEEFVLDDGGDNPFEIDDFGAGIDENGPVSAPIKQPMQKLVVMDDASQSNSPLPPKPEVAPKITNNNKTISPTILSPKQEKSAKQSGDEQKNNKTPIKENNNEKEQNETKNNEDFNDDFEDDFVLSDESPEKEKSPKKDAERNQKTEETPKKADETPKKEENNDDDFEDDFIEDTTPRKKLLEELLRQEEEDQEEERKRKEQEEREEAERQKLIEKKKREEEEKKRREEEEKQRKIEEEKEKLRKQKEEEEKQRKLRQQKQKEEEKRKRAEKEEQERIKQQKLREQKQKEEEERKKKEKAEQERIRQQKLKEQKQKEEEERKKRERIEQEKRRKQQQIQQQQKQRIANARVNINKNRINNQQQKPKVNNPPQRNVPQKTVQQKKPIQEKPKPKQQQQQHKDKELIRKQQKEDITVSEENGGGFFVTETNAHAFNKSLPSDFARDFSSDFEDESDSEAKENENKEEEEKKEENEENNNDNKEEEEIDMEPNDDDILSSNDNLFSEKKETKTYTYSEQEMSNITRTLLSHLTSLVMFGNSDVGATITEPNEQLSEMLGRMRNTFMYYMQDALKKKQNPQLSRINKLVQTKKDLKQKIIAAQKQNVELKSRLRAIDRAFKNQNQPQFSAGDARAATSQLKSFIQKIQTAHKEERQLINENQKLAQQIKDMQQENEAVYGEEISAIKDRNAKLEVEITENVRRYKGCIAKMEQSLVAQDEPLERLRTRLNDLERRVSILSKPRPKLGQSGYVSPAISRPFSKTSYV